MRSWLLDFFGPSITVRAYSITGFTLVRMGTVSVCRLFCLQKVVQNPPVLPAPRMASAFLPAALPLKTLPPAVLPRRACRLPYRCRFACYGCRFYGLPCLPRCLRFTRCRYSLPRCPQWPMKRPQKSPRAWHGVNLPPPRACRFHG
jgi:hypothetical protein